MKKIIIVALILTTISCQKQFSEKDRVQQLSAQTESNNISVYSTSLSKDADFIQLANISKPLVRSFSTKGTFPEFSDGKIFFKECNTLYSKMGFPDSASCAQWFISIRSLSKKLMAKYPNATNTDYSNALTVMKYDDGNGDSGTKTACQNQATGQFLMDVAKCSAYAAIPIVGEVLAGTCMIGALMDFNGALEQCSLQEP
ncbi:MAG TPA: hypothetical protein PLP23_16955 [Panacibacter sp.]|nr:hypothetical protein [Panacibacter sp.]